MTNKVKKQGAIKNFRALRKITTVILVLTTLAVCFAGCKDNKVASGEPEYGVNEDGTLYVSASGELTDGNIVIPSEHDGKKVTAIGTGAFFEKKDITGVTIPQSITAIGEDAFRGCEKITAVNYNGTVAQWCNIKFASASSNPCRNGADLYIQGKKITDLNISSKGTSDEVLSIGDYAFTGCGSLRSVTLGDGVTVIGAEAFRKCASLENVKLGENINHIGSGAFSLTPYIAEKGDVDRFGVVYCGKYLLEAPSELEGEYTVRDGTKLIGGAAFFECTSLTSITLPAGIQVIDEYAFYVCVALEEVNMPQSLEYIGRDAFYACIKLEELNFPASLVYIGENGFYGCTGVKTVKFAEGNALRPEGTSDTVPDDRLVPMLTIESAGKKWTK